MRAERVSSIEKLARPTLPAGVAWKDPKLSAIKRTSRGRGGSFWRERLAPLIERPHHWARISTEATEDQARQRAAYLRNKIKSGKGGLPGGTENWEIVPDELEIFARYGGPPPESAS